MTRKDYQLIAGALAVALGNAEDYGETPTGAVRMTIGELAYVLAKDNPRFDSAKFLKASGVQN